MISFTVGKPSGRTESFLNRIIKGDLYSGIEGHAQRGVDALRAATPRETGASADAWTFEIVRKGDGITIWWVNTHQVDGFNVVIGLQYGHGTGTGGWVEGYDFINPSLKAIFDEIANDVWKEVQSA